MMQGKRSTHQTSFRPNIPCLVGLLDLMYAESLVLSGNLNVKDEENGDGARFVSLRGC